MALFNKNVENENMPKKQFAVLTAKMDLIKREYIKATTRLGAHVFHLVKHSGIKAVKLSVKATRKVTAKLFPSFSLKNGVFKGVFSKLLSPFVSCKNYFSQLSQSVKQKSKESGLIPAVGLCLSRLLKSFWNRRKIFITAFNYGAPVVSIVFLVNLITYGSNIQYGISVECNGQVIGYVEEESVYEQAHKVMQERITYVEGDIEIEVSSKLSLEIMSADAQTVDVDSLADAMISNSDVPIVDAYGFYINGVYQGAVADKTGIENTLNSILNQYRTGTPGEVVSFVDNFELKPGLYLENGLIDDSGIIAMLTSQKQVEAYYTIESGDSPLLIAEKVGMPYSELKMLNPSIEQTCFVGDQVLLNRAAPYADVRVKRTEEYDVTIPFETVKVDDATKYKGTETVLVKGSDGEAHVIAEVSYVNGYEESRNILEQVITLESVDKKVAVGTKKTGASDAAIAAAAGKYLWPVGGTGGYISSGFGSRYLNGYYEYHKGIDIAAPYGTPIYAAADGYVTMSKKNSSYGNCVMIDHGSGYVTLYAHASKLIVSSGTYVQKGDLIALVGSTGKSYGNHLHFEVRYNGTWKNPVSYIKQ